MADMPLLHFRVVSEGGHWTIVENPHIHIHRNGGEILRSLGRLARHAETQRALFLCIQELMELFMATQQDVSNEISALRDLIVQDQQSDQQAVDQLQSAINDLKQQIADLQLSSDQSGAFDSIISQLRDVKSTIKSVSTTARNGGMSETDVTNAVSSNASPTTATNDPDSNA